MLLTIPTIPLWPISFMVLLSLLVFSMKQSQVSLKSLFHSDFPSEFCHSCSCLKANFQVYPAACLCFYCAPCFVVVLWYWHLQRCQRFHNDPTYQLFSFLTSRLCLPSSDGVSLSYSHLHYPTSSVWASVCFRTLEIKKKETVLSAVEVSCFDTVSHCVPLADLELTQ